MATKASAQRPVQRAHHPAQSLAAAFVFLAMLLAAFSLWTAIPLSWVYIASKLSHTQFPSGGPYAIVAVGIIASVLIIAWLIGRLNNLYIRLTGTNRLAPIRPSWLKSMRDTAPIQGSVTVVEAVLMSSVLLAALALTVWFFLLAGSPIPNQ
jgi:small-conductance mechanosensitive channel